MERNSIHRAIPFQFPFGSEGDDHASSYYPEDDVAQVQRTYKPLPGRFKSGDFCGDINDPFGYYILKIVEIESQHWLCSQPMNKRAVCFKLLNSMQRNLASFSPNVCSLPVVLRGGGFAGRAGILSHGLRFPTVV
jgi:hypothetical protein